MEIENFDELVKDPVKLKEAIAATYAKEKENIISTYDIENDDRVKGLKTKNTELLGKMSKYEGVNLEEYTRLKQLESESLKNTNVDEYIKVEKDRLEAEYQKVLSERDNKIKAFEDEKNQYAEEKKRNAIGNAFSELTKTADYKLKDVAFKKEAALVSSLFVLNEKNEIVHKDGTLNAKTGKVYTLNDYVEELKVNEAHLFDNLKTGTASGLSTSTNVDGFRKLTMQESLDMRRENPELFAQFKEKKLTYLD